MSAMLLRTRLLVLLAAAVLPASTAWSATVDFNDGGSHTLSDPTQARDAVRIRDGGCAILHLATPAACASPGAPTQVTVLAGAQVGKLWVMDASTLAVQGGLVQGVQSEGGAAVTIDGGQVVEIEAVGTSSVTLNGGSISGGEIAVEELATLEVGGGAVDVQELFAAGFAHVEISGGSVAGNVVGWDFARVVVSGGAITADLTAWSSSVITVVGSDFEVDEFPASLGVPVYGQLTGTLLGGDPIDTSVSGVVLSTTLPPSGSPAASLALFNDGSAHLIDDATHASAAVGVRSAGCGSVASLPDFDADCPSPGAPTAVELATGGVAGTLQTFDTASLSITGGNSWQGVAIGESSILMSDGTMNAGIHAEEVAAVTMIGGGFVNGVGAEDHGTAAMSGGSSWAGPNCQDFAACVLSGGSFDPAGEGIEVTEHAMLTVAGTGFQVDGSPVPYGPLVAESGTLTGTLESGDPIDQGFFRDPSAAIVLVAPPAPVPVTPSRSLVNDGMLHVESGTTWQGEILTLRALGCASAAAPWAGCDAPGASTSLELASPGVVGHVVAGESGTVDLAGGDVLGGVEGTHASTIEISAGSVGSGVVLDHVATAVLDGGQIQGDVRTGDFASVAMSDGDVLGRLLAEDYGDVAVSGGTVGAGLFAEDRGRMLVSGGVLAGEVIAEGASEIRFLGSGFQVDGSPVPDGPIAATAGTLTGTLLSGAPLSVAFSREPGAVIALPEPGGILQLAAGAAGLLCLRRLRRRGSSYPDTA